MRSKAQILYQSRIFVRNCSVCRLLLSGDKFTKGRTACRGCVNAARRHERAENPASYRAREAIRRAQPEHRFEAAKRSRKWYSENRERAKQAVAAWAVSNPAKVKEIARRKYQKGRADMDWSLRRRVRIALWRILRGRKGDSPWFSLLGYTPTELRVHLERQFVKGMGWHNMGEWHIDHIIPLSSFTITGPDDPELRRAWALTNLRPLWAKDNMSKGAKRLTLI